MICDISSYSLSDFIPFSQEVVISLFRRYNESLWPSQFVIALIFFFFLVKKTHNKKVFLIPLALSWALIGYFFHWKYLKTILWAGNLTGWLFFLESFVLLSCIFFAPLKKNKPRSILSRFAVAFLWTSLLFPLSYIQPISTKQILLLGWDPTATSLGTLGVLLASYKRLYVFVGSLIPIVWLLFALLLNFHFINL
jgi:hypothetical protein